MTMTITSFTPTTGPCTGGTLVVITGTGLTAATSVMFGDVEGVLTTLPSNSATQLTVIAPAIPNASAGTKKITLLDSVTPAEVQSSSSYTYTAVTNPVLVTAGASKWKLKVDTSVAQDFSTMTVVRGITSFQPQVTPSTVDDSDYDSPQWGSDFVIQNKWSLIVKFDRKTASGYVEDPGQAALRAAYAAGGAASVVNVQWFDRNGGVEAFQGAANVQWSEDGGGTADKSSVTVTLGGRGARTTITNPLS